MGQVRMETKLYNSSYSDGYHDCKVTYYIYCDKCGSFAMKEYRTVKTWAIVAVGLTSAMVGGSVVWLMPHFSDFLVLLSCFFSALVVGDLYFTIGIYLSNNEYRCRKCGNTDITMDNVLNYQEEDRSVVDVPEH